MFSVIIEKNVEGDYLTPKEKEGGEGIVPRIN